MTRRELFKALTFGLVGAAMPLPKAAAAPAPAMIPDKKLPGAVDLKDFEGNYTLVGLAKSGCYLLRVANGRNFKL